MSSPASSDRFAAELRRALLAEIGARSIYARLALRMRDPELGRVLVAFHEDEALLVENVRQLSMRLGDKRAPRSSFVRASMSWILAACSGGKRSSMALRLCHDSECTVARWYHELALELVRAGELDHARSCSEFAQTKQRHARILETWVAR